MLTLNQIISARGAAEKSGACFVNLAYYNRRCWHGTCEEVFEALEGDCSHDVETHDGIRIIYRKGDAAPRFVQCGVGFINPFWS